LARAFSRRSLLGLGGGVALTAFADWSTPGLVTAEADVIVYGATVAGISAAIQARRMGRTALILEPSAHIGGMTTGGLGNTDIGAPDSVGGLADEFYRRVGDWYAANPEHHDGGGITTAAVTTGVARYTFEPSVASAVLGQMLTEAKVPVHTGVRLRTVDRRGTTLLALVAEDGRIYRGRMFVDAGYEGDLMAAARVSWTMGREGNALYGERYNGVQVHPLGYQETLVDPYVVPGSRSSGLLPGIAKTPPAPNGTGDDHLQAYTYRMNITRAANRIPFAKPDGYDPAAYELHRRYMALGASGPFFNASPVGNGTADSNNAGPYSTDFVGQSQAYPTATWRQRESIADAHRVYQQGLTWFLANDPRVPPSIRKAHAVWGLPADQFTTNGGWPTQLYVRETRRMLSDYVMTEHDTLGERSTVVDSVGLASYVIDVHTPRRVVVNGKIRNEGWLEVAPPGPYPISYRSIVPRQAECANLLVPVCLAASHSAYGSIRMEPVFMILGQSAGAAAVLAIEADTSVQRIVYPALRARLVMDRQLLDWPPLPPGEILVDNADYYAVTRTGTWRHASGEGGYVGNDIEIDDGKGDGKSTFRFTPTIPKQGKYTVYLRYTMANERANNLQVDVVHIGGTTTVPVNQRANGGTWVKLGDYPFHAGRSGSVLLRNNHASGVVVADAVRFAPIH
jgi:hypothetical protein